MDLPDEAQNEELSDEAWQTARRLALAAMSTDWPELPPVIATIRAALTQAQAKALDAGVRRALNECYFYGLLYGFATLEAVADLQGLQLRMPAILEAGEAEEARRLISYETTLPFLDRNVPAREAKMLADRFRGLAELCDRVARR